MPAKVYFACAPGDIYAPRCAGEAPAGDDQRRRTDCNHGQAVRFLWTAADEREGISRQAVHDLLRRTTAMLEQYEEKLKMMRRFDAIRAIASSLEDRELAQRIIKELD